MNFAELTRGTKVLLVAGLLLLIDSFLAWQQVSVGAGTFHVTASANMWHGVGVVAGLLVIALLIWEGLQLAGVLNQVQLPVSAVLISVGLAAATALFTIIKFLVANEARHWPSWIGLILAIAIAVGGWLKYSEAPAMAPTTTAPPTAPPA
jgi:hypothetical protein